MMETEIKYIDNLCVKITDGSHFSPEDDEKGQYPMYSVKDMEYNSFSNQDCKHIGQEVFDKLSRQDCRPLKDDIVIAKDGSYLKYVFKVKEDLDACILSSIAILRPNKKVIDPDYFVYLMRSASVKNAMANYVSGSALPRIILSDFKKMKIAICSNLESQKQIASVLSAYDSQIENNQKRIKLLEQMAESLYKEWFVRFRFPGYENAEFEGGVPKVWEKQALGNYVEIKRGGSPRPIQDFLAEEGLRWLKISDATSTQGAFIFEIKERILESGLNKTVFLKAGSLVLSNSATPGIPKILAVDSCIHDGWLYFQNSSFSNEFLYLLFNYERPNIAKLGNGAVFTNLKTDIVKGYQIFVPPTEIRNTFQSVIEPLFIEMKCLQRSVLNLTHQRDLLLPRLMSGKLSI